MFVRGYKKHTGGLLRVERESHPVECDAVKGIAVRILRSDNERAVGVCLRRGAVVL